MTATAGTDPSLRRDYVAEVLTLVFAAASALVLLFPGAAMLLLLAPTLSKDRLLLFAASPCASLGLVFCSAEVLRLTGLPLVPWQPLLLAVVVACAIWRHVAPSQTPEAVTPPVQRFRSPRSRALAGERISVALLFVAVVVGLLVWGVALAGQPTSPPSRDGEYHGFFVKRIVDTGTTDPARVLVTDPITEEPAAEFYPLTLHAAVALQNRLSTIEIGPLLTGWVILASAAFLPAGMFVLLRRLLPERPLVAGFSSLVCPFIAMFPYGPASWSGITLVLGLALTPACIVMVGLGGDAEERRWQTGLAASLCLLGVVSTHTSQLAFLALVLGIIEGAALVGLRREHAALRRRSANLVATLSFAFVGFLPSLAMLGTASTERSDFFEQGTLSVVEALWSIARLSVSVPEAQVAMAALLFAGLLLAARDRRLGPLLLCLGASVLLFLGATVANGFWHSLRPLSLPWYHSPWRTSYNVSFLGTPFIGYALASTAQLLSRIAKRFRPVESQIFGAALVAAALLVAGVVTLLQQPIEIIRNAYSTNGRTTPGMTAAFDFLESHTKPDEPVLNEERDGSAWMYAAAGLRPLLAVYQHHSTPQTEDRLYLATHIAGFDTDRRVRELLLRWGVRYVMVNDVGFVDEPPRVRAEDLRSRSAFTEVFSEGGHARVPHR